MLRLEGISVAYGRVPVLHDISLAVKEGEIVSLIGPNNAGKSTLLRTIMGLVQPKMGRILLNGDDLVKLPPFEVVERGITLVPEGRQIFGEMTVEENLLVSSNIRRARRQREANLRWVYTLFPSLKERRRTRGEKLSGGEAQMLSLGRGLMSVPDVLLLDEPSLGLGPIPIRRIFATLREINHAGLSILLVEQNVRLSLGISHRSYLIHNGAIAFSGESQDLMKSDLLKKIYLGTG